MRQRGGQHDPSLSHGAEMSELTEVLLIIALCMFILDWVFGLVRGVIRGWREGA